MNSDFRINPLNQMLVSPGIASRSFSDPGVGPAEVVTIVRKWGAGNIAWLELTCAEMPFDEKFSVLWIAEYQGKHFVLLQQEPVIDDEGASCQFILRIINESTLFTVDARQLESLIPAFQESFKNRAPWVAADSAKYFGELPAFGSPQYKSDKLESDKIKSDKIKSEQ